MRVFGSPDPYAAHIDGMGGATSSTSKCVILAKSRVPDHDVDYLYGQVSIDKAFVDWSGNCGNLSTAAGAFALDGATFPAAEIVLEFIDPSDDAEEGGSMFPTGNLVDDLEVPGVGTF